VTSPRLPCATQSLDGEIDMQDLTGRYSNRAPFRNIAPLICEVKEDDVVNADPSFVTVSTAGTTVIAVEGAFMGTRTWAAVDGIKCGNLAAFSTVCATANGTETPCGSTDAVTSSRREYLHPPFVVNPLFPKCPARALEVVESAPKIVKCVVPVGYGASRSLVVYNGNQPSSAVDIHFRPPVVHSVSATVVPTAGVDWTTGQRVAVRWAGVWAGWVFCRDHVQCCCCFHAVDHPRVGLLGLGRHRCALPRRVHDGSVQMRYVRGL